MPLHRLDVQRETLITLHAAINCVQCIFGVFNAETWNKRTILRTQWLHSWLTEFRFYRLFTFECFAVHSLTAIYYYNFINVAHSEEYYIRFDIWSEIFLEKALILFCLILFLIFQVVSICDQIDFTDMRRWVETLSHTCTLQKYV